MNGDWTPWQFLFSQQNEARPAVPRLVLFLAHRVNRDLSIDVGLNVGSAVGAAVLTLLILKKSVPVLSAPGLFAIAAFLNLNFFSFAQWQNWNWQNQLIMLLPNFFFALGWYANISVQSGVWRGLIVTACCAASTFCFANGLVQWFLLIPMGCGLRRRQKFWLWTAHFGAAAICLAIYFHRYKQPSGHNPYLVLGHFGRLLHYFLAWLGSSLSVGSLVLAEVWGAVLLFTFLILGIILLKPGNDLEPRVEALPWVSMGLYAIISGVMTSLGRSHIGLQQALRPRYCAISQWLIIGLIGLAAILLWKPSSKHIARQQGMELLGLLGAAFLFCGALQGAKSAQEWNNFGNWMHFQEQSFGLEAKQPGQVWTFDHPDRQLVLVTYNAMKKAGFLCDKFKSDSVLPLIASHQTGRNNDGEFAFCACLPFRQARCQGWSVGGDSTAGNRLLVVLVNSQNDKVLAVGDGPIDKKRLDVVPAKRSSPELAGFDFSFPIPKMTSGSYFASAFRYNPNDLAYHPLGKPVPMEITR